MIALVPGEEELGAQRQCRSCGEWWPDDVEFWRRDSGRRCRACINEYFAVTHRARYAANAERERAKQRERNARRRTAA